MTQFGAFKGLYSGTHALVLGPNTTVWLVDVENKNYVVEQHGRVIPRGLPSVVDQGRLSPLQAKHFTEAATGAREIARTVVDLNRLVHSASA